MLVDVILNTYCLLYYFKWLIMFLLGLFFVGYIL